MATDPGSTAAPRRRLGEILVAAGTITSADLEEALRAQRDGPRRRRLGRVVIELDLADEHEIAAALAQQLRLEVVDSGELRPDRQLTSLVGERLARLHEILPLSLVDGRLRIATADPTNVYAFDDLRAVEGVTSVQPVVATSSALEEAIGKLYADSASAAKVVEALGEGSVDTIEDIDPDDADVVADEPVIRLVNALLADAVRSRASDVHVEPERDEVRVRYRIDGILREVQRIPRAFGPSVTSRLKIMSSLDIAERRRPQDGRANIRVDGNEVDLRVSTMPTMFGETTVLRLLRKGAERMLIDDLGFDGRQRELVEAALARPQGLVVMTGPTGSGKTTSLYAGLTELADPVRNVVTLEDPIEYQLSGVNQTQIAPKIGLTFARGLRTVLRQDPDVVMVGEIRDTETAELALEASFTGHLVLSTLHTNDAPSTIARLIDLGVERFLIATTLSLVVAQRLGRTVCRHCAVDASSPDPHVLRALELTEDDLHGARLREGAGCVECDQTGFLGRVGLYEMLPVSGRMRQLITDGGNELQLAALGRAEGMRSLREDGIGKALAGTTTLQEVLRVTPEDQFRNAAALDTERTRPPAPAQGVSDTWTTAATETTPAAVRTPTAAPAREPAPTRPAGTTSAPANGTPAEIEPAEDTPPELAEDMPLEPAEVTPVAPADAPTAPEPARAAAARQLGLIRDGAVVTVGSGELAQAVDDALPDGWSNVVLDDPDEALEVAVSKGPDLIVVGQDQPDGRSGLEVVEQLRLQDRHVRLWLVSAEADDDLELSALVVGVDDVVAGDIDQEQLSARLASVV